MPRNPRTAALLGAICIGAGLVYVRRIRTAAAAIALEIAFAWLWFSEHFLPSLFFLAMLWYWQMWYGYDVAENSNKGLINRSELES